MEIKENEIIVKNENFMMFLNLYFKEEYGIGMHGIEGNDCWIEKDGTWELNKEKIDSIKGKTTLDRLSGRQWRFAKKQVFLTVW